MVVVSPIFSPPEEGVLFHSPGTKLLVDGQEVGTGSLYITENNVLWGGGLTTAGGPASTISLLYPNISMHALQREPVPALMVLVNYALRMPEVPSSMTVSNTEDEDEGSDNEFDPSESPITELRFLPQNEQDVVGLYTAMCQGQELHPDPQEDLIDDDHYMDGEEFEEGDGDEEFEDAEESNATPEDAAARLRQMRLHNGSPHGDESPEEGGD